jgi:hypothetical protein
VAIRVRERERKRERERERERERYLSFSHLPSTQFPTNDRSYRYWSFFGQFMNELRPRQRDVRRKRRGKGRAEVWLALNPVHFSRQIGWWWLARCAARESAPRHVETDLRGSRSELSRV